MLYNLNNEQWKTIEGFDGAYEISNHGRVKSHKRAKSIIMKSTLDHYGYYKVNLYDNELKQYFFCKIHRLVAQYFVQNRNPEEKTFVNHLNSNKQENHYKNLSWTSPKENYDHAFKNGRMRWLKGENHPSSKLSKKDVDLIRAKYLTGDYTLKFLGDQYGVSKVTIYQIVKFNSWV